MSATSSDEDRAPRRSLRSHRDRGVINRVAWAYNTQSDSESGSDTELGSDSDGSDGIPLAQPEERSAATQLEDEDEDDDSESMKQEASSDFEETHLSIKSEVIVDEARSQDASDTETWRNSFNDDVTTDLSANREVDTASDYGDEEAKYSTAIRGSDSPLPSNPRGAHDDIGNRRANNDEDDDSMSEYDDDDDEDRDDQDAVNKNDFAAASTLLRQLRTTYLSNTEKNALQAGHRFTGPPVDRPLTQIDQWKRKYRWPIAVRNIRRRRFAADMTEHAFDYEVAMTTPDYGLPAPGLAAREAFAAALAPTVRPLMGVALAAAREQSHKRKRHDEEPIYHKSEGEEPVGEDVDLSWLRSVVRLSAFYGDHLLDSIIAKNAEALQGLDDTYPQQCWDSLPRSKRPVANWRFILEHFYNTSKHSRNAPDVPPAPRLRKSTLLKIRDRLRTLYGQSWRPEDEEFLSLADRQESDPADLDDAGLIAL